ncbi:MAG: phenylalanine--tRNA ligase beta subunit-related protein [Acidobacteriota bacterium]|nr:phenylalanine--tRNA ligase beta subunit-related protein [Acidobacteriota bacterium]
MTVPESLRPWVPEIEPSVRPLVLLGIVRAEPVAVAEATAGLDEEIATLTAELAERYEGRSPGEIERLKEARDLYKSFGIDPTKTRPSSEALLRRALKGKPFPRVLNAVDIGNLCSVQFLLPLGLYDAAKVKPPIVLRRGRAGESYAGIRKDEVHLQGRPALADVDGAFGNPTSDSLRCSVTTGTTSLYMVIFATAAYAVDRMEEHVGWAAEAMTRHLAPAGAPVKTATTVV